MTTVLGILGLAALFAAFGLLGPALERRRCAGEGTGCGSCTGTTCKYSEE